MDTGSCVLWVFGSDCVKPHCEGHTKFKDSASSTYECIDDKFKIRYASGKVEGKTVEDTVFFSDKMIATSQKFGTASSISVQFPDIDGVLGMVVSLIIGKI